MRCSGVDNAYQKSVGGDILPFISKSWDNYVQCSKTQQKNEEDQQEISLFRPIGKQNTKKREQKSHNSKTNGLSATFCNGLDM